MLRYALLPDGPRPEHAVERGQPHKHQHRLVAPRLFLGRAESRWRRVVAALRAEQADLLYAIFRCVCDARVRELCVMFLYYRLTFNLLY